MSSHNKSIIVIIDKTKIKNQDYDVLENAFKYNIQRIENSLNDTSTKKQKPAEHFMIITDEGRVGKMAKIARKIQRINYIPSKFGSGSTRQEIKLMIEDPLAKNSAESYFIQAADTLAFISSLYATKYLCNGMDWANRIKRVLTAEDALALMEAAKPILNIRASSANAFGIVYYPR